MTIDTHPQDVDHPIPFDMENTWLTGQTQDGTYDLIGNYAALHGDYGEKLSQTLASQGYKNISTIQAKVIEHHKGTTPNCAKLYTKKIITSPNLC